MLKDPKIHKASEMVYFTFKAITNRRETSKLLLLLKGKKVKLSLCLTN
jgi:hypothetical protein